LLAPLTFGLLRITSDSRQREGERYRGTEMDREKERQTETDRDRDTDTERETSRPAGQTDGLPSGPLSSLSLSVCLRVSLHAVN